MTKLLDPARLAALAATGLLDARRQDSFDNWTRLARRLLRAPVALISFIDDSRQVLSSHEGLAEPLASAGALPLSHSICKYVVDSGEKLVLNDVREVPFLRGNPGVEEGNVASYLGVPLAAHGEPIGTFCVFDHDAREWTETEIAMLEDFARAVETHIALSLANAQLAERERLLSDVLNLMPAGVVLRDEAGRVLRTNLAMTKILGRSEREIVSSRFWEFTHPDDRAGNATLRDRLLRGDASVVTNTKRCLHADGHFVWVRMSASLLHDPKGEARGTIAVFEDVSSEREAAEAILHQARVYHAIAQNIPRGAVFMFDHDLRYLAADGPELLRAAGLEKSRIEGHTLEEVAQPENFPALEAIYRKALAGQPSEFEGVRQGRTLMSRIAPIWDGDRVRAGLAFVQDVTEERKQQEAVRRTKSLFETTIGNIRDGVALLDTNCDLLLANRAFAELFGFTEAELGRLPRARFLEHVSGLVDDPVALQEQIAAPTDSAVARVDEIVLARPRRRILRRTRSALELPDRSGQGYLAIWQDITTESELISAREREALCDALTGIANRRAAERAIAFALAAADLSRKPLSVALFDVDHFKRVNDSFGHAQGDEVLKRVAACIAREARTTDTVARWGGEEFVALLPVPLSGAVAFCERVRKSIEAMNLPRVGRVTISAGVTEFTENESAERALSRADALLYAAKDAGRNRVSA